jgi:hypothetical protein
MSTDQWRQGERARLRFRLRDGTTRKSPVWPRGDAERFIANPTWQLSPTWKGAPVLSVAVLSIGDN